MLKCLKIIFINFPLPQSTTKDNEVFSGAEYQFFGNI